MQIGEFTYFGTITKIRMVTDKYRLVIGKFCSLGENVRILVDMNHRTDWMSTYPFGELIHEQERNPGYAWRKGDMVIG
ncbi:MAG: hypothetical protein ACXV3D_04140 [Halobacteriota archaeon]